MIRKNPYAITTLDHKKIENELVFIVPVIIITDFHNTQNLKGVTDFNTCRFKNNNTLLIIQNRRIFLSLQYGNCVFVVQRNEIR